MMYSEKQEFTWPERLIKWIPGISGYMNKERAREIDHQLRMYIVDEIVRLKQRILRIEEVLTNAGQIGDLDVWERIHRMFTEIADRIKYASRGYSGVFDLRKIGRSELEQLVSYDQTMIEYVRDMDRILEVQRGSGKKDKDVVSELQMKIEELGHVLDKRLSLFQKAVG